MLPPKTMIKWRCRRGVLELDVIFERFFDQAYDALSAEEQLLFAELLEKPDPILQQWLIYQTPVDPAFEELTKKVLACTHKY